MGKRALVLLSGGMDSTTCLAIARAEGVSCYSLSFDYGQRHRIELEMAAYQARVQGVERHLEVFVDLAKIGGSALTAALEVPKLEPTQGIPITYVPGRNVIFLSIALAWAEVLEVQDLYIGANQVDFSGYPDCRDSFLRAFEQMANLATRAGTQGDSFRIQAPLLNWSKAEIIQKGLALGVDYRYTHTCYDPPRPAVSCGLCPSCRLRLKGFEAIGAQDPLEYLT